MRGFLSFLIRLCIGGGVAGLAFACNRSTPTLDIAQLVKTTTVHAHAGDFSVTYPGILKAASDVKLSFRVAGPIHKIWVKEGQYVQKGALLAQLDPRDYSLQYEAAAAGYKQVKGETDRIIELYRTNSVSENDYDKAVAAQKQAWALYHARLNALEDTKLKAPFSGYIQKKYFSGYEVVNQGVPVLSMIDDDYLEVNADIPAEDFIRSGDFLDYRMKVDVYPDTLFALEFVEMNQQANFNQLFQARFRMKRSKEVLLAPGMIEDDGRSYVWRVEGDDRKVVRKSPVEVYQVQKDGTVIVSAGLQAGDVIVSAGANGLKEGQKIRVLPPVAASNVGHLL